jgi:alpha-glucosidase
MLRLRRANPALQIGDALPVEATPGVLAFERRSGDQRILCLFELGGEGAAIDLPTGQIIHAVGGAAPEGGRLQLPRWSAVLVRLEHARPS